MLCQLKRSTSVFSAAIAVSLIAFPYEAARAGSPGLFETKDIAESAYIYGFPMIANYKALYQFNVDKSSGQYKAPFNQICNDARVFTPKDTAIVTPNSDTPYSLLQMDLRAEPIVLCVPEVEKGRYYSVQLVDMYTFNYGYIGSRTTGNGVGCFMVAGPGWKGETPAGIDKVFPRDRVRPRDLSHPALQPGRHGEREEDPGGYKVQTPFRLSRPARAAARPRPSARFTRTPSRPISRYLNFLLQFCPEVPGGDGAARQFAEIGISRRASLSTSQALDGGSALMLARREGRLREDREAPRPHRQGVNGWRVGAAFGDRAFFNGDWLCAPPRPWRASTATMPSRRCTRWRPK